MYAGRLEILYRTHTLVRQRKSSAAREPKYLKLRDKLADYAAPGDDAARPWLTVPRLILIGDNRDVERADWQENRHDTDFR